MTKVKKILAVPLLPLLIARLEKIYFRLYTSIIIQKGTTQGTALSLEKICQKSSICLSKFRPNN